MSFKAAASDFDGTIYRNEKISDDDIAAVRAWRAAGNKFGIVTGRAFIMLEPLLKLFGLETDFNICCNGAAIYDGDGRIIFQAELEPKLLLDIMNEPCALPTFHFAFEAADEVFCARVQGNSWVLREEKRWNFPVTIVDDTQVPTISKPINQLALDFSSPDEALIAADMLNAKFGDKIRAQKNTHSLDIVPAGVNKAQGVENLLQLMNWRDAKVFVIGDESNDLPMIKNFGGYTVSTAKDFVKREATAVFDSVGDMLNNFRDA
ncbi:MAG: HAD family phosphatase [Selenomonadaceae bacterium]|nr:HAD family phosphatase [Selenomonadaceae bacterium]